MSDSILENIKKLLNVPSDVDSFDTDIVLYINAAFSTLNQLGVGPRQGFSIQDEAATWDSFLEEDPRLNGVKSYVYLRTRLLFDPPGTSFLVEAIQKQISELEWRLNLQAEEELWTEPIL